MTHFETAGDNVPLGVATGVESHAWDSGPPADAVQPGESEAE